MSQRRLSMRKIRELLRLKYELGRLDVLERAGRVRRGGCPAGRRYSHLLSVRMVLV